MKEGKVTKDPQSFIKCSGTNLWNWVEKAFYGKLKDGFV